MKNITKLAAALMVMTILVGSIPVAAMAQGNSGKDNGKNKEKTSVEAKTILKVDKSDKDKLEKVEKVQKVKATTTKEQVDGEKKGVWSRIMGLLTFGAGKSGKVPPGLLKAPGIQKKISGMSTTTVTVFPGISNITVSQVASTSVRISWRTNKPATSALFLATSTPVGTTTSRTVISSQSNMTHTATLTGLTPATNYFYKIVVTDSAGKVSSSTELSFTTSSGVVADTVAPVISNIVATTTMINASTTGPVHVKWTTNEAATSKVWFGTSTPVVSGTSTQMINSAAFVTNHDITLPTLAASTTYYMMVSSADAAGNTSTSAEFNFNVLP
jgi:hypothetical protein